MCTCRWVWAGLMTEWVDGSVHVGGCVGWVGDWVGGWWVHVGECVGWVGDWWVNVYM